MADDLNTILKPKRNDFSDGRMTNTAATSLPAMATQDLNTAAALPNSTAQGVVQPPVTAAPTLASASPLAPVAAPAAQAAAAAPATVPSMSVIPDPNLQNNMTPPVAAGPVLDPNLQNRAPVGTPAGGASQIPGLTPQDAAEAQAFYKANPNLRPGQEPLISGTTMHTINSVSNSLPPQAGAVLRAGTAGINALTRALGAEKAAVLGKDSADIVRNLSSTAPGAAAQASKVAPGAEALTAANNATNAAKAAVKPQGWWNASSAGQKTLVGGALATDVAVPLYQAGTPDQPLPAVTGPGQNVNGYPNSMGAPLDSTTGQPTPYTPPQTLASAGPNDITKTGNSYTGGPNIAGGVTVNGQQPGGQSYGLGGPAPTAEEAQAAHQRNLASYAAESQGIADRTARTLAQDEWNGPTPGMVAMDAGRTGGEAYDKFKEDVALNTARQSTGWTARGGNIVNKDNLKAATDAIENRTKKEAESTRQLNDINKTKLTTAAENARAAATNAITMRGQNLTAETARGNTLASIYGSDSKAGSERAKLQFEAMKSDREFIRTAAKDGQEKAEKEWKARNDAQDEVTKRAQGMRDPADKAGAARDAQSVMTAVEDTKAQLEAMVKANPADKEASDALDKFKRFGARNFDDTQIHNLIKGAQLTEKVNAANAKDPNVLMQMWRGTNTGVVSNEPFTGIKKISRVGAPDVYVETDASGRPIGRDRKPLAAGSNDYNRVIPASVVERDEGLLGFGGFFTKPSADFRTLNR